MLACYPLRRFSGTIGRRPLCFCLDSGLRAGGLINQCHMPYRIGWPPPPPQRFRKRGEPRAEPPICDPSCAGGCQFNSPALGLAPALFARARLAAGCRKDSGASAMPALNAAIPWKASAANGPGNYCDSEAFPGRSPPARPPTLLVSASPPWMVVPPPRKCSEMFGNVRKMFGTGGAAPPAFPREVAPPGNVRKMFGNGECPLPWGGGSCKNVRKCSEMFGTGAAAPPTFPPGRPHQPPGQHRKPTETQGPCPGLRGFCQRPYRIILSSLSPKVCPDTPLGYAVLPGTWKTPRAPGTREFHCCTIFMLLCQRWTAQVACDSEHRSGRA